MKPARRRGQILTEAPGAPSAPGVFSSLSLGGSPPSIPLPRLFLLLDVETNRLAPLDARGPLVPVQAHPTRRKVRWSTPPPRPSAGTHAQPYRRRRPETTTLHRIVREHLETYLALANESDGDGLPDHVEKEFQSYLRCGILAHGFARARCSNCGYDFLVAFSCKGRGACPSCNAKRMAETAAHLVDHVIPHVPVRQWVLSVPKRLRPFFHHKPRTAGSVLHILLRALQATLREACPTAPPTASFGAVSFLHRFGSSLNPHFHFHLCVTDGLFQRSEEGTDQDPANPPTRLRFQEATALTHELLEGLQHTIRSRVLRHFIELSFASFDGLAGCFSERSAPSPPRPLGSAATASWSPTTPRTC